MVAVAHAKRKRCAGRTARGKGCGGTRRAQRGGTVQGAEVKRGDAFYVAALADFGLRIGTALHLLPLRRAIRAVLQCILTASAVPGDAQIHVVVVIVVRRKLVLPCRDGGDKRKAPADVGIAVGGQSLLNEFPAAGGTEFLSARVAVKQAEKQGVLFTLRISR